MQAMKSQFFNSKRFLKVLGSNLVIGDKCAILRASFTTEARVGIIGAPMAKGQQKEGVEKGPDVIRKGGLIESLEELEWSVNDYGNVEFNEVPNRTHGKLLNSSYVFSNLQKVSDKISEVLSDKKQICLTLGGDHSLGISTVHGHSRVYPNQMSLLWVDAHADINTALTTNSGNIHGMPVSFILREMEAYCPSVPGLEWLKPCLNAENMAYIGLRDVEPSELFTLQKIGIKYYSMTEIDKLGIHAVVQQALKAINPKGDRHLHVSFDIDALDKSLVPCTGTPVPGGLTRREAITIAEEIAKTGTLVGLDLVEVNPLLGNNDEANQTVQIAIDIIASFLGRQRQGNLSSKTKSLR